MFIQCNIFTVNYEMYTCQNLTDLYAKVPIGTQVSKQNLHCHTKRALRFVIAKKAGENSKQ